MDWILKRKWYINHKVIHGILYDEMGDPICHTLENMELDNNGQTHCLPEGVHPLTSQMLTHSAGAYGKKDNKIIVGQKHPSPLVKDCLLHSPDTYYTLTRRVAQWNRRHKTDPLMLTII